LAEIFHTINKNTSRSS